MSGRGYSYHVHAAEALLGQRLCASRHAVCNFPVITLFLALLLFVPYAHADETNNRTAQTILHLLDYVSVDYGGSVLMEKVVNESEYREQADFADQAVKLLDELPEHPEKGHFKEQGQALTNMIQSKLPAEVVTFTARKLRQEIIDAYQIQVMPKHLPDMEKAKALYQQICSGCHGAEGGGDGVNASTIDPRPANFRDTVRMAQRSVFNLYNAISLGVGGTAMKDYSGELSEDDRWSLAFLVINLQNNNDYLEQGRTFWKKLDYRGPAPNLTTLSSLTSNEIILRYGEKARAVFTYLRSNPQALYSMRRTTLLFATEQLDRAAALYGSGDKKGATRMVFAAYLEGFEPMEISLDYLDTDLRKEVEHKMARIRNLIADDAPIAEVRTEINAAKSLMLHADELLRDGKLTIRKAFESSLLVLLREGVYGMFILGAIIAFLIRIERHDLMVYIHSGWGSALLLGILSGIVSDHVFMISGGGREIIGGLTALIVAGLLIYIGLSLRRIALQKQGAGVAAGTPETSMLGRNIIWALMSIAYFALYRGIFESVLFYQALWTQVNDITSPAIWSGIFIATLILITGGWVVHSIGNSLPDRIFYSGLSFLLGVSAVVQAGQGVEALQEANIIAASNIDFISFPLLGIHPTAQTLLMQLLVIGILIPLYRIPLSRKSG